jgi:hypothetical protein
MEHEALLLGITQVAVTLAGFSGLVVAIRGASPEAWHARDIWSLTWMFGSSFGALFLALLPLVLAAFHIREELIWRSGDLVLSAFVIAFSMAMLVWGHRLTKAGHPPRVRFFPAAARLLLLCCGVLSGAEACGVFPGARSGFFIMGLIGCLMVAALSLVVFLVVLARATTTHRRQKR